MATQPRAPSASDIQPYRMTFDQSAHLDWDWKLTFAQHFWYGGGAESGVQDILTQAISNLQQDNSKDKRPYYYSICEMSFLKKFVEENPTQAAALEGAGENFQVLGGGMTSPDCLVCSGEGFIRNYLVGHVWLAQALPSVPPRPHCIIPDDFGQGPELPVLLQALGFVSVTFSRLENPALQEQLTEHGFDFVWRAADGSQTIGHWMGQSYGFALTELEDGGAGGIKPIVKAYGRSPQPPYQYSAAATAYMYMPVESDFSAPFGSLLTDINTWNTGDAQKENVEVAAATFDTFIGRLLPLQHSLQTLAPYNGTPYWTGYYASRPALKILHYGAVRALVAAEIFGMLTQPNNTQLRNMLPPTFWDDVAETWSDFAPSTHHDYVCGTAIDSVYATEQLPLLRAVEARAGGLRAVALNALAANIPSTGVENSQVSVVVANSVGFPVTGLAEVANVVFPGVQSVSFDNTHRAPVQISADGGMLLMASAPSLGYVRGTLSTSSPTVGSPDLSIFPEATGANSYVLRNEHLTATISESAGWGIERLHDSLGAPVVAENVPSNELVLRKDSGSIYRFGNETGGTFEVDQGVKFATTGPGLGAVVLESGPLRVRLRTVVRTTMGGRTYDYVREYVLVAGEPSLRMSTTGAAPVGHGYSVTTRFRFTSPVTTITHGTGYHWTAVQPAAAWEAPVFQPTHDFLLPQDSGGHTLAAVYHGAIPAWASDGSGGLIGCLLRNTPTSGEGAGGTDPAQHTQHYALRVPKGLGGPKTGAPLREALAFNTPLQAVEIPPGEFAFDSSGMAASTWSLASVNSPAMLTVAKPGSFDAGSLILRLYQPTNQGQPVEVTLAPGLPKFATIVNATETPLADAATTVQSTENGFSFVMNRALATVQVVGAGLKAAGARR